ncbi:hypothetical protein PtB15_1B542 [Puccinia triticina]|nr:hypothetical protein PtB15_1B542 [Puccinia triticina]
MDPIIQQDLTPTWGYHIPWLQDNHQLSHKSGPDMDGSSLTQRPTPAPYSSPRTGPTHQRLYLVPPPHRMSSQPDPHSPVRPPASATQSTTGPTGRACSPSDISEHTHLRHYSPSANLLTHPTLAIVAAGPKRAAQRQRTGAGGFPPGDHQLQANRTLDKNHINALHRLICQKDTKLFGESPMLEDLDKLACVCPSKENIRALAAEIANI